ncbi:MAG: hypothetical protein ACI9JM_002511 [Halioglobus sp.]
MSQSGAVLFLALKMSQNSIDDVLVFYTSDNPHRGIANLTAYLFNLGRHLVRAEHYWNLRISALNELRRAVA